MKKAKLILLFLLILSSNNLHTLSWKKYGLSALAMVTAANSLVQAYLLLTSISHQFKANLADLLNFDCKRFINEKDYIKYRIENLGYCLHPFGFLAQAALLPSLVYYVNQKSGIS